MTPQTPQAFFQSLLDGVTTGWPRALFVLAVFVAFYLIAHLFKAFSKQHVDVDLYKRPTPEAVKAYNRARKRILIGRVLYVFFLIVGFLTALGLSGVDALVIFEGAGFAGLGLAYAFADFIQQYFAGFLILTQQPINIGEQVEIDGNRGVVKSIEPRYTVIEDFSEREVLIPNSKVLQEAVRITPVTGNVRDVLKVRIAPETNVREAIDIGETALATTPGVSTATAPKGYARYFGDSLFVALYYTLPAARREAFIIRSEAILRVKEAYDRAGVKVSYPSGVNVDETTED